MKSALRNPILELEGHEGLKRLQTCIKQLLSNCITVCRMPCWLHEFVCMDLLWTIQEPVFVCGLWRLDNTVFVLQGQYHMVPCSSHKDQIPCLICVLDMLKTMFCERPEANNTSVLLVARSLTASQTVHVTHQGFILERRCIVKSM